VLCLGKLYKTQDISWRQAGGNGFVSRYAWGSADYHEVLRAGLERLVERLTALAGPFTSRICVDTAPLLERSLARLAGLGWIGKNTCLINQSQGSWFFLGFVLTDLELEAGAPPPDRCGTCRRCIDACPTQAILQNEPGRPGPWRVDGRLCLSTLTIETKGAAPESTRAATGPHLFGCDICQEVCPWNRRAPMTSEPAFQPVHALLDLAAMAELTPAGFRERFRQTPIWRAKYSGWLRNVATAMGNSGDRRYADALKNLSAHEDEAVAEHARWALERLGDAE
jgi:epoxyqueuosine reductase